MTGNVINLRQARKRKARAEKEQRAAENRRKFARTRAERELDALQARRQEKFITGHRRDKDDV